MSSMGLSFFSSEAQACLNQLLIASWVVKSSIYITLLTGATMFQKYTKILWQYSKVCTTLMIICVIKMASLKSVNIYSLKAFDSKKIQPTIFLMFSVWHVYFMSAFAVNFRDHLFEIKSFQLTHSKYEVDTIPGCK